MTDLDKLTALTKRRGFIFQAAEIYGGVAGFWDWGPYGVALKNNIRNLWWREFVEKPGNVFGLDSSIVGPEAVFRASGHIENFADPLPDNQTGSAAGQKFNLMFKTSAGASAETAQTVYLRPETAQGIFINFKKVVDSLHPKLPFGLGQVGKAFRNEITPRDFIFRAREFEQLELEYFVKPEEWEAAFEEWRARARQFFALLGLPEESVYELEVPAEERAHYSRRTIDFEFTFPFGRKELAGLAYRGDFDLSSHAAASGLDLSIVDEDNKTKIVPHVIEPSFGLDRLVLAVLTAAYKEDKLAEETRVYLDLPFSLAPVKVAVFPLLRNKPELIAKARAVFQLLTSNIQPLVFDDNGNIGKRYRRQDEIGTPYCVTIDFDTLTDDTVTVRERNSGQQQRVAIAQLTDWIATQSMLPFNK